jgi:CubicO group peptidase (beta-lactamase class C family)
LNLPEKIDAYLISALNTYQFNGVALVAKNGAPIFHKAYGWRDLAGQAQNDTSTIFPVLSITKSFTAVVMLKLQEEGKLSLKDTLNKYLPDYPQAGRITLEQLLTHSSGIYNYTNDFDEEDSAIVNHPVPRQMVLDRFYDKPLEFEPGKGFSYNNSAYFLAGLVIEKATGKSYEQNVRQIIFEPLGMIRSGFDYNGLPSNSRATGYQFLNATVQKPYTLYDSTVGYAAGSIYSTSSDMLKWAQAIIDRKVISQASWNEALTAKNNGYGYGFQMGNFEGKEYIHLPGGYPGFVSDIMLYPKDSVAIILLKNSGNYGQDLFLVTLEVSNIVFGKPYDLWQPRAAVSLPEQTLKQMEGKYKLGKMQVTFFVKDNHFYGVNPYGAEALLLPASEDTFFSENYNTSIRFVTNAKGKVVKMIYRERGSETEWKRTK